MVVSKSMYRQVPANSVGKSPLGTAARGHGTGLTIPDTVSWFAVERLVFASGYDNPSNAPVLSEKESLRTPIRCSMAR